MFLSLAVRNARQSSSKSRVLQNPLSFRMSNDSAQVKVDCSSAELDLEDEEKLSFTNYNPFEQLLL